MTVEKLIIELAKVNLKANIKIEKSKTLDKDEILVVSDSCNIFNQKEVKILLGTKSKRK